MADRRSFVADPVIAAHAASPLQGLKRPGEFGALTDDGPGVFLTERTGLSIGEVASWKDSEGKCRVAIRAVAGVMLNVAPGSGTAKLEINVFNFAPGRWLVAGTKPDLVAQLAGSVGEDGSVTDLSHGRVVIRIDGPKSRWVLSKLFAINFANTAFARGQGLATMHHDITALVQRVGEDAFDIHVFRSFARSFWSLLRRSSEEVGYRID
ncbi:sarcosine oxidase subunit gamma family protein [Oricola sp.]|uniref:sarcosine oxidase subunit gamma family protein n=1 Tax=Oricola sp. TaxID=1979950 RepID=UPI0025FE209C|nr:sarcosine oxidase subunit gamma family protein [Oricola sp.]MCI5076194.1 sarcosine oxidase subunit gamma [Oricola sp.]